MNRSSALAFDRASSVRRIDADGRLHVATAILTKSCVSGYVGAEIPDFEKLGLDPQKQYKLLRDPEELRKAVKTFDRIPLLSIHVAVSSRDHRPDLVVGSTGSDAEFDGAHLTNSLVVWAQSAIDDIESGEKRELSCAYKFRAVMDPGTFKGERYDGRMTDLIGNHVAVVDRGRVTDAVIGDAARRIAGFFEMFPEAIRLST